AALTLRCRVPQGGGISWRVTQWPQRARYAVAATVSCIASSRPTFCERDGSRSDGDRIGTALQNFRERVADSVAQRAARQGGVTGQDGEPGQRGVTGPGRHKLGDAGKGPG